MLITLNLINRTNELELLLAALASLILLNHKP